MGPSGHHVQYSTRDHAFEEWRVDQTAIEAVGMKEMRMRKGSYSFSR